METKRYRYPFVIWLTKVWGGLFAFIGFLAMLLVLFTWYRKPDSYIGNPIGGIIGSIILQAGGIFFIYWSPDIWVSSVGIEVEFLWYRLPVRWDQIMHIIPGRKLYSPLPRYCLIKVKGLTFFHRLYTLFVTGSLAYPGFVIHDRIEDYHELLHKIRQAPHVKTTI